MKIQHQRLYEQVISYIQINTEKNNFKIGEKLPTERSFAEQLNVSRGTLRDAFRVLESRGIIETRPGAGRILIKPVDSIISVEEDILKELKKSEILDLLEARELLEVGMCTLVCARITDEEIQEIEDLLKRQKDEDDFSSSTYFHLALASACNNHVLENFIKLNMQLIKEVRDQNFTNKLHQTHAVDEHLELLSAIKKRDILKSEQAVRRHFEHMRKRLHL
ncbi:FadR/GntR family transcriptional regulator [Psychrobacillus sp. NPDC096389]|uniref:FadR/GntR family transcriptional regulator n=1 Tax=Psychrobacillus sp. NPDC096389 TaxID=3364490 RepID=UPI00381D7FA4